MDIAFPSQLQWVTPLVGSHWPAGSESAWWRTAGYLRDAAAALEAQIPDLAKVRSKTYAVLVGETAQVFKQQTAQLFSGNTAVAKKVEALRSLGDVAESFGTEIQYTKLSIYSMLVIAAGSIVFALANSEWTLGASLAQIPVIRWLTENAMARLVTMVLGRIEAELAARLGMLVARLVVEGLVSAGIGAAQEGGIEAIQVAEGHRDGIDVGTVLHSALSMGLAGVAGGLAGHAVGGLVGTEGSTALRALKGAVTGLASGEAANLAGTLAGGGHIGTDTLVGGAIGLVHGGLGGGVGEHGTSVQDPTETPMPANAIDTHPTLRFEKQPDGSFAWPGEQAGPASDSSGSTNDGVPQAIAPPPATPAADPAGTTSEGATGSPGANGSPDTGDSPAKSSNGSTAATTSPQGEVAGPSPGAVNATPSAPDTAASPTGHLTAGVDPAPATNASLGSGLPEGRLDLSSRPPPVSIGPVAEAGSPPVPDPFGQPSAAGLPATTPDIPRVAAPEPSSTPPASSDRGPSLASSSPTPDARAGLAKSASAAGESAPQPAGAPTARTSDITAAQAGPGAPHGDLERVEAGQASASVVERPAPPIGAEPSATGQAGRPGTDAHPVGRGETARGEGGRTADPLTTRRDPARPDSSRNDSNRPSGARTGKLHRSDVVRDIPKDLLPATTHTRDPLAAAQDTGVIKAHNSDSGPGPGDLESNKGGRDGSGGDNASDPGAAAGGAGGYRGGDGGRGGGAGGDSGDGGVGPGDGSGDVPESSYPRPVPPPGGKFHFTYEELDPQHMPHYWQWITTDGNGREYRVLVPPDMEGPPPINEWRSVWGPKDPKGPFRIQSEYTGWRNTSIEDGWGWEVVATELPTQRAFNGLGFEILYRLPAEYGDYRVPDGLYATPWGDGYLGPLPDLRAGGDEAAPPQADDRGPAAPPSAEEPWIDPEGPQDVGKPGSGPAAPPPAEEPWIDPEGRQDLGKPGSGGEGPDDPDAPQLGSPRQPKNPPGFDPGAAEHHQPPIDERAGASPGEPQSHEGPAEGEARGGDHSPDKTADTAGRRAITPDPVEAAAAHRFDTTATHTEPGTHDTPTEHATSAQAVGADPAAPAGRSEANSHAVGRQDSTPADRQQRPAEPVTKREEPSTRPGRERQDPSRPPGKRGKLRSGVARDTGDLQPVAAIRAPDPRAAGKDISVIKARHGDSSPDPRRGELESHNRGRDGRDGPHTPDPATAGGGAGDDHGGAGGNRGDASGHGGGGRGAGHGGAGPGDGSGAGDPPDRGDGRGGGEEPAARGQELTSREREVLQLKADGLSLHDIAARLSTDFMTVVGHVARITIKLKAMDIDDAITKAQESGLIESTSRADPPPDSVARGQELTPREREVKAYQSGPDRPDPTWYRGQPVDERLFKPEVPTALSIVFAKAISLPPEEVQLLVEEIAQDLSAQYPYAPRPNSATPEYLVVNFTGHWVDLYRNSYLDLSDKIGYIEFRGEVIHDGHRIGWVHMTCDRETDTRDSVVSFRFSDVNEELVGQHSELFRTLRAALEPTLSLIPPINRLVVWVSE